MLKKYTDIYMSRTCRGGYVRIGNTGDGGYVMLDDFAGIDGVLSFGIGSNITWENEMAKTGAAIEMYDPTVDNVVIDKDNMFFYKIGVARKDNASKQMNSFENILNSGHLKNANNMILKMDVEGCEWDVLPYISKHTMKRFRQMVFEFHGIANIRPWRYVKIKNSLNKLNQTHQLVHVHGNNSARAFEIKENINVPYILEATYLNRDYYTFAESQKTFPTELDSVNIVDKPEIILGRWT